LDAEPSTADEVADLGEDRSESRGLNAADPDWPKERIDGVFGRRRWIGGLLGMESLT
jgi:hypothetical protein